jgi:NTE family protein
LATPDAADQAGLGIALPRIGLALSGGGCRAIAFHLGCLRALHDLGILQQARVLSTVSGGSVIGALYMNTAAPFGEFEAKVRSLLAQGLVRATIKKAFLTTEGVKALCCFLGVGAASLAFLCLRRNQSPLPLLRFASRTTLLRRALDDEWFEGRLLSDLKDRLPFLIINATELRTGSAFYFTAKESGSWRIGKITGDKTTLAHAVTASAAYPLALPALDERLNFKKRDGSTQSECVSLTDGGVYDNLGLSPLWPDRDSSISLNVDAVDTVICCRAGYGLRHDPPTQFFLPRLKSVFACIHERSQNGAVKRLFELKAAGKIKEVVMPYLGQDDSRLKFPPANAITRKEVLAYPTDFSAMTPDWIDRLSRRGEQLTRALLQEHAPELLRHVGTAVTS